MKQQGKSVLIDQSRSPFTRLYLQIAEEKLIYVAEGKKETTSEFVLCGSKLCTTKNSRKE